MRREQVADGRGRGSLVVCVAEMLHCLPQGRAERREGIHLWSLAGCVAQNPLVIVAVDDSVVHSFCSCGRRGRRCGRSGPFSKSSHIFDG